MKFLRGVAVNPDKRRVRGMMLLFFVFIFLLLRISLACIPVSLPDDSDGFTTTTTEATTTTETTTQTTTTTTTAASCLMTCQDVSAFTECSAITFPAGYTCNPVVAPTVTRSGTTCSFTLDCTSFGTLSYPNMQVTGTTGLTMAAGQTATFTCQDGQTQWTDSNSMVDDYATCASENCLATCPDVSTFTDCSTYSSYLSSTQTCQAPNPVPTSTRGGTSCMFTLDCTTLSISGGYPQLYSGGGSSQTTSQTVTFTCNDGQTQWMDNYLNQLDDNSVCAYTNCLATCPAISTITDCASSSWLAANLGCQAISPTPTATYSEPTCMFEIDCSTVCSTCYPYLYSGGIVETPSAQAISFSCGDGQNKWIDSQFSSAVDNAVCAYPNCLSTCPAVSDFTNCATVEYPYYLPESYTCQSVAPTPSSSKAGTSCSFTLDCSSLGPDSYPQVIMGATILSVATQSVSFNCDDFQNQWTDSSYSLMDDYAVCAYKNCLSTCPAVSDFTNCATVEYPYYLPESYTCQSVSPTPTNSRTGTSCSFTLDCSSLGPDSYPQIIMGATILSVATQSVSFNCDDFQNKWTDSSYSLMDDYAVCAYKNCLQTCPDVMTFTDCPTLQSSLPPDHTCQPLVPAPTVTKSGTTCSFTLDCSSLGPTSMPIWISGGVPTSTSPPSPTVSFTCDDFTSQWIDSSYSAVASNGACVYQNCLSTCPQVSDFTSCAVYGSTLNPGYTCDTVIPTPTASVAGMTCSFTLDCTSAGPSSRPIVYVAGYGFVTIASASRSVDFTCMEGTSQWKDSYTNMVDSYALCATGPPDCLLDCFPLFAFTDCANGSPSLPPVYTCMNPTPTPTATKVGSTCSFTLDCSGLGPTYQPQVIMGFTAATAPGQTLVFTCNDGDTKWTDAAFGIMDDYGVCATL